MQTEKAGSGKNTTTTTKTITKAVVPGPVKDLVSKDPNVMSTTKHEEWTTSRKKINHKTKQVETRVQRQIVLEDGKVIADSGPQVTTRTTEDNKTEETENSEHKTSGDDAPEEGYVTVPGSAKVVSEKVETHQTVREKKEENMELHDESFHDLSGEELHHKALTTANDLPFPRGPDGQVYPPGKLTHYTSRSQKVTDKDEVKEISELQNGEVTTETTRTHHHEEAYDDEIPEDEVDESALPEISAETTRKIEYLKDDDDIIDSLSDKLRKELQMNILREHSPERRDPLTKKTLDVGEEEIIRSSETTRWLDSHFGSDTSDSGDSPVTKSGGNIIKIEMAPKRRTPPVVNDHHEHEEEPLSYRIINTTSERLQGRESNLKKESYLSQSSNVNRSFPPKWQNKSTSVKQPMPLPYTSRNGSISHKTPLKTYYLGENDSYKPHSTPRFQSTPLIHSSSNWKSSPSLTENISSEENRKIRKHDSFRHESTPYKPSNPVQRSQSQRESHKNFPSFNGDSNIRFSSYSKFLEDTSHSLPRESKFSSMYSDSDYNFRSFKNHESSDKVAHIIPIELPDEKDRSYSPAFVHRPEKRESQTLPRSTPRRELFPENSVPKMPKRFYFGEPKAKSSNTSYLNASLDRNYKRSNGSNYTNGRSSPTYGQYHTIERNTGVKNSVFKSKSHSSFEDSKNYSNIEQNRSTGDSFTKPSTSFNIYRPDKEVQNGFTKSFSTLDINSKNNEHHNKHDSSTNGYHNEDSVTKSFSTNFETKRHQFMKGLLEPEDNGHDVWINKTERTSNNKMTAENRQRHQRNIGPSPPISVEITRSKSPASPPSSPPPRLIPITRTDYINNTTLPVSPSYSASSPKGTFTKSKGKIISSVLNPPSFTPLMSPLEIKNMTNTYHHTSSNKVLDTDRPKYIDVRQKKKESPVMVEVRDWDSR